jgi:hypothetical protein
MKRLAGIALVASAVSLTFAIGSPRCAFGIGFLTYSPAMRSQGMGSVGVADDTDPANAFFNPAVIASARGAFLTFGYNSFSGGWGDEGLDNYAYNVGAGGSFVRPLGEDWKYRIGAGLRYNSYKVEFQSMPMHHSDMHLYRDSESYTSFTLGAGCALRNVFYGSLGLALKPWREEYGTEPYTTYSKTPYDFGLFARLRLAGTNEMTLSSSAGVSFLNLGGVIHDNHALPETYRYGLGLHLLGIHSEYFRERFGADVPVIDVSVDYDFIDDRTQNGSGHGDTWALGTEIGLYQIFFVRTGYNHVSEYYDYTSFGLGLGFTTKKFWGRFDVALVGQGYGDSYNEKYGLSLGFIY